MKKIIVAPLNWGLGHASRCAIIIKSLLDNHYTPILAGDGDSLHFLRKEFPHLETIDLPSYAIRYGKNLKLSLLFQSPKMLRSMISERKVIEAYIEKHSDVVGIISDNRFGVRSRKVPSVYITHQLQVRSGWMTFLTSFIHRRIVRKFNECWVPDDDKSTLSGALSSSKKNGNQKFIGILSRLGFEKKENKYNLAVVLSGVEPRRSQLEEKLHQILVEYTGKVAFVRGVVEEDQKVVHKENMDVYNYVLSNELQEILNTSEVVLSRSGYSTIMDLAATKRKAVLIPTKGQTEQEYLGAYLSEQSKIICAQEDQITVEDIYAAKKMKGLEVEQSIFPAELFRLFEGE